MAPTTAAPAAPTTPIPGRLGYQPALDGVRALAISLVVLFHYPWKQPFFEPNPVHGGFLGVDVFFVLSGYLITALLLQEHATLGRISLKRFYARRALRLLPAFFVLFAIAVVLHFALAAGDGDRPDTLGLFGMLFYAANWVNVYRDGALGVVAHTWSLAIEEQFYLVWPAILVLLLRKRLRLSTIAYLTTAGIVAASVWRVWQWWARLGHTSFVNYYLMITGRPTPVGAPGTLEHRNDVWNRIYFGSDTRADALLVGCLTAIVLFWALPRLGARARVRLSAAAGVALIGCALIIWKAVVVKSGWLPVWGILALEVGVAVVIAGLVAAPRNPLARVLALAPLAWLGRRSYAVYLFHTLVYKYCRRSHVHLSAPLSFVFQIAVVLAVAELSHRLIEAPMLRRKQRFEPALPPSVPPVPT
jgi:peptidoglycan/LPS O-acetylase OafA/YrhL